MKADGSGALPASASSRWIVSVLPSTAAEDTRGATVSGVLFVTGTGPKFVVEFERGVATSRSDPSEAWRTVTVCELFGGPASPRVTVEPRIWTLVGVGWLTPLYATVKRPALGTDPASSCSLIVIATCVPAASVAAETNVGGVMSGT